MDNGSFKLPANLARSMRPEQICTCLRVSESEIRTAIRDGCNTFSKLQDNTGCSTGCGCCEPSVRRILDSELKKKALASQNDPAQGKLWSDE